VQVLQIQLQILQLHIAPVEPVGLQVALQELQVQMVRLHQSLVQVEMVVQAHLQALPEMQARVQAEL